MMDLGTEVSGTEMETYDNNWGPNDEAIWATEDEYRNWNYDSNPNKKRSSQSAESRSNAKAIGRMFYKTKLCCKFRAGICPYVTNCNFAHGLEELRKPPPNWQEIVAAHEEDREEHQIPTISTTDSRSESQRAYKGRHCKKFYTEEGCPYGDNCTFLHDEQSRSRESVAISVTPVLAATPSTLKPSNWKTRICNKWETTGSCPFGPKCHFAHGWAELHNFTGGAEGDGRESSMASETKPSGMATKTDATSAVSEFHHAGGGIASQRPSIVIKVVGQRPLPKWKGPDKISRIYGDWIDDIE
ncbi:zinc finger CCCH domain-containing protein 56 [Silene latifolia]|uniref:zinc finger CCCH domain-containing protein 56 n=1 Tax=Silene latifolia TaxID=37657 RepID=UPI003D78749F